MEKLSYYEIVADTLPGLLLIVGLSFSFSYRWPEQLLPALSVGGFGVVALLSYVVGNLLQGVGNLIESVWWRAFGGWPTEWVWSGKGEILIQSQCDRLFEKAARVLGVDPDFMRGLKPEERKAVVSHIYAVLNKQGRTARIDSFNGTYGLLRGAAAAALILSVLSLWQGRPFAYAGVWGLMAAVALFRMHRFGKHYARELYLQFLELPDPLATADQHAPR